jgi:hypothetical protein
VDAMMIAAAIGAAGTLVDDETGRRRRRRRHGGCGCGIMRKYLRSLSLASHYVPYSTYFSMLRISVCSSAHCHGMGRSIMLFCRIRHLTTQRNMMLNSN